MTTPNKVRIDKWLWSIRIFKSRTLATDACREGKVRINGIVVKPSAMIGEGETAVVKKDGFNFEYKALQLIEKRVGAPIAATCYENVTPEAELNKYKMWFENQTQIAEQRERGTGRPTKRDRRQIDAFKD